MPENSKDYEFCINLALNNAKKRIEYVRRHEKSKVNIQTFEKYTGKKTNYLQLISTHHLRWLVEK